MKKILLVSCLAIFLFNEFTFGQNAKEDSLFLSKKIDTVYSMIKKYCIETNSLGDEFKEHLLKNNIVLGEYIPPKLSDTLSNFTWNDSLAKRPYILIFSQKNNYSEIHSEITNFNGKTGMMIVGENFLKENSTKIISCSLLGAIIETYGTDISNFKKDSSNFLKVYSMYHYMVYLYGGKEKEKELKSGKNVNFNIPKVDSYWILELQNKFINQKKLIDQKK